MGRTVQLDSTWLHRIAEQLNDIDYGQVTIIIHDGRITQIEKTVKKRYEGETAHQPKKVIND